MPTPLPVPATPVLLDELRLVYAETLEIPLDKVTADADLAADLGADSLTLDELMVLALGRYGLSVRNIQAPSYPTIGALAGLIERLNAEGRGGEDSRPQ
jgi:acyl carrier protein